MLQEHESDEPIIVQGEREKQINKHSGKVGRCDGQRLGGVDNRSHRCRHREVDLYGLDFRVVLNGILAKLTPNTRLLEATERYVVVDEVVAVNPDGSGMQSIGGLKGLGDVFGEDCSSEAVHRVIGEFQQVILVVELGHDDNRAEDLLFDDPHLRFDISEDRRLNEETVASMTLATEVKGSTLLFADGDVVHD